MNGMEQVRAMYRERGFAKRLGFGQQAAVIVVDFMNAFTHPQYKLGGNYDSQIESLIPLLESSRQHGIPIIYMTTAYHPSMKDAGIFAEKVPSLNELIAGTPAVEVDRRIQPEPGDYLLVKKFASSFFGTSLASLLQHLKADTLIVTGCTTSGCIRATVVDANQFGFRPIVPRECVGDRDPRLNENNLFDMDAKYGDVTSVSEVLDYIRQNKR